MSTSFPSFCPKTTDSTWFAAGEHKDDEIDIISLESKYDAWLKSVYEKDKDVPYIGRRPETSAPTNEIEPEGESEESEEEEDLNDYQDSPEEQNTTSQANTSMDAGEDGDDSSWIM